MPTKRIREQKSSGDKYYVVKDGDSLWGIAQVKLGSGKRFPEIAKLNKKVLKDEDSVYSGMRLRLPGD